jgi:penicillin-binding protein 1B
MVPLYHALAHSYNVATARLGLVLGLDSVIATLRRLGIEQHLNPYPSLVLGAVEMSPLQVTGMYQTFASGGFRMPLRAISAVRYPLSVESVIDPAENLLVTTAMQFAVREGTARAILPSFPAERFIAGKTGTTDALRDSWFAGFTDERLGVVWIGRDDNQSTGLTGSSGALLVWRDLFSQFNPAGWSQPAAEGIEYQWIDPATGLLADGGCRLCKCRTITFY